MTEYHADDYALSRVQSSHIRDTYHNGALNGISIMPNSPYLDECMEEISDIRDKLFITVHLNFVEGRPLTGEKAAHLTDKDGNFNIGFGKLLAVGFIPFIRRGFYKEIKEEIKAQLDVTKKYMNDGKYRIDGHVHYHMLPLVFDALMEVISEKNIDVEYIRFPREELAVYRKHIFKLKGVKAVNIVKVLILNTLSARNERKHREQLEGLKLKRKMFMGVFLSGHMFYDNLMLTLPDASDIMVDRGYHDIELLFHPGDVSEEKEMFELTDKGDVDFLSVHAADRRKEAEALRKFGGGLRR